MPSVSAIWLGLRTDRAGTLLTPEAIVDEARRRGVRALGVMDVTGFLALEALLMWVNEDPSRRLVLGRELRCDDGVDVGVIAIGVGGWRALCELTPHQRATDLIASLPDSIIVTTGCERHGLLVDGPAHRAALDAWIARRGPKAIAVPQDAFTLTEFDPAPWIDLAARTHAPYVVEQSAFAWDHTPSTIADDWLASPRPRSVVARLGGANGLCVDPSRRLTSTPSHRVRQSLPTTPEWTTALRQTEALVAMVGVGQEHPLVRAWSFGQVDRAGSGHDVAETLRARVLAGLVEREVDVTDPAVVERLEFELERLVSTGWATSLLAIADVVGDWYASGVRLGPGRGSATNLLVAYGLGITEINPLEWDLSPYVVLSTARHEPPDIDIDVPASLQPTLRDGLGGARFVVEHHFGTKASLLRSLSAHGLDGRTIDRLTSSPKAEWRRILETTGRNPQTATAMIAEITRSANALNGVTERLGEHVSGVLLPGVAPAVPIPVEDGLVIVPTSVAERSGGIKLDVLPLNYLDRIARAAQLAEVAIPDPRRADADVATWDRIVADPPEGMFQLTDVTRAFIAEAAPRSLGELAACLALVRPRVPPSSRRAFIHRHEPAFRASDPYREVLEGVVPFGAVIFRDDVGRVLERVGGFAPDVAYGPALPSYEALVEGLVHGGLGHAEAAHLARELASAVSEGYLFRHGHALAYAIVAWQCAHLAVAYPEAWAASATAHQPGARISGGRTTSRRGSPRPGVPTQKEIDSWFQAL